MQATPLIRRRVILTKRSFADIVVWRLPDAATGDGHGLKYRLAYVVDGLCVVRYDNERRKGDHRHVDDRELPYRFSTLPQLLIDFRTDIKRWDREHSHP